MAAQRRALESADRDGLAAMDIDFENCRLAWRWAIAHQASELLERSVLSLLHFCDLRDRYEEGLSLIVGGLHTGTDWMEKGLVALLQASAAHLHYRLDRYAEAEAMANRGLAIARRLRQPGTLALCLQVLGSCSLRRGQHAAAREHFEQAHRHAVAANDPRKAGVMLHNQALVENALGRTDDALRLSFAALGYYRQAGDVAGEALCLNNVGLLYMTRKEPASATAQLQAGLAICDRHGFPGTRGLILANLTELAVKSRDLATAARHAAAALEIAAATGNRALDAWVKFQLARLALADGDLARARQRLAAAMEGALTIDRPSLQLDGLCCFAELLAQQGAGDCARAVLQYAAEHPSMNVPDRDELRAQLAADRALAGEETAVDYATLPADLDLRGLAHRIVIEAGSGYEPLIASMRRR
jgi:tetratricopeptide (TPR) repeat protein